MAAFKPPIPTERVRDRERFSLRPKWVVAVLGLVLLATVVHFSVRTAQVNRAKKEFLATHAREIEPALNAIAAMRQSISEIVKKTTDGSTVEMAAPGLWEALRSVPVIYARLTPEEWPKRKQVIWEKFPIDAILRCVGVAVYQPVDLVERTGVVSEAWWKRIRDSKSPFFLRLMNKEFEAAADKERKTLLELASARFFVLMRVVGADHRVDPVEITGWDIPTQKRVFHFSGRANPEVIQVKNNYLRSAQKQAGYIGEQNTIADCSIGLQLQEKLREITPPTQATP